VGPVPRVSNPIAEGSTANDLVAKKVDPRIKYRALANVVEKTFDEMCNNPNKQMQSFTTRFEYRGDVSVFTASGSNDTPLPDTSSQPMTSGTASDRSFVVPLSNECILLSGRVALVLHDAVKIEVSPRHSNNAMKPSTRSVLHVLSC
jgi:hypothetical protein